MYAIVEIQGQQFRAEAGKKLYVHYLGEERKEEVVCEVKAPLVKGEHIIVFKKKRRKGYRRLNGHRQQFTQLEIKDVIA